MLVGGLPQESVFKRGQKRKEKKNTENQQCEHQGERRRKVRRCCIHLSSDSPAALGRDPGEQGKGREQQREITVCWPQLPAPEPLGKGKGVWRERVRLSMEKEGKSVLFSFLFFCFLLPEAILIGSKNYFSTSRVSLACDSIW